MRNIINISLPAEMAKEIKKKVKEGNFASTSEFMRHIIRLYNTEKLARELEYDRKNAKWKTLKSLKDLR